MRIEKQEPKIRNPEFNGPMLFEHQALAPGPRPKHFENYPREQNFKIRNPQSPIRNRKVHL